MIRISEIQGQPDDSTRLAIYQLYEVVFGRTPGQKVLQRLQTAPELLILLAYNEQEQLTGFKIGYRQDAATWYSWLGGVLPEHRGQGIAAALMEHQHEWAKKQGYQRVQTKTMNRWRSMLILNLKQGFDIIGTYTGDDGTTRIILQKKLNP